MNREFATLAEFAAFAKGRAALVEDATQTYGQADGLPGWWETLYLNPNPNEDDCRFCRAMSTCPAWAKKVEYTLGMTLQAAADCFDAGEPLPVPKTPAGLSVAMKAAGGLEDWAKAVRAEVERQLMAGDMVEDFGLELGKQGDRAWIDKAATEVMLRKVFRLKVEDMYDMKLKSPTSIEKMAPKVNKAGRILPPKPGQPAPVLGPKQWAKLQPLIGRAPAKPSVKPMREIKTPWTPEAPSTDAFEASENEEGLA